MKIRLIFSLLVLCSVATARTYYVATPQNGGNDNYDGLAPVHTSGSHGPWASWEKAFTSTSVQPGDTVFIRGGVYYTTVIDGTGLKVTRNGTSDNWIVYINYPGEKPVMDFGNITAEDIRYLGLRNDGISISGVNYVKLFGLTIRNVKQYFNRNYARGIYLRDGIVIIENCTAYHCWGHGIHSQFSSSADETSAHYIINCDSHHNCDSLSGDPLGSNAGATGAGFDAWFSDGTNGKAYFHGCRAWGNSDQGFTLPTDAYVELVGCWSFGNTSYIHGGGSGFKLGWQNIDVSFLRRQVINCIAAFNDGTGFFTNETGSGGSADWNAVQSNHFNNTAYHNGYGSNLFNLIIENTQQVDSIQRWRNFSNNIDYASSRGFTHTSEGAAKYSGSNNTWDIPLTLTDADFISLDTTGITAPRQADGSLPDNDCYKYFLKPSSTSQLIGAGIDVGLTYDADSVLWDDPPSIGAFEFISKSTPPPAPPVYSGSVIENTTPSRLDMTYNVSLANIIPAASAFTVRVNSSTRTVTSVVISGTKVQLTLSSPVVYGDVVTVAYTKPATNPLQTPAGGQAASISSQAVTNNVAAVSPVYISSVIENATPSRLDMTYNMSLTNIVPAASAFTVRVNSSARSVTSVGISGTKVQLTLSSPVVNSDVVTMTYTKPATNPLQTSAGGQAASISSQPVTNNVADVSPVYNSSVIENATPSRLDMTFNMTLANIVPAASAFTVRVNSSARSVTSVVISGTNVQLTLSSPVVNSDVVAVTYTKPATNPLQTSAGGQAASISSQPVTNNVADVSPVYNSSVIENATPSRLDMTFNMTLANIVPAASAFTVRVNSSARTVTSVVISGTKVHLTLSSPVVYDDVVTVAYTKPVTNPLQSEPGGQSASMSPKSVTNNCRLSANQPPVSNISSPGKSSSFTAPATIELDVNAYDPDGTISKVELFNNNVKIAECLTAPYTFTWKEVPAGTYTITAIATDNQNAKGVSDAIAVTVSNITTTVNQLPTVSITSPVNKSSFEVPQTVSLTAEANDPDGAIIKVEYYYSDIKIGESTSPPFMIPFEIKNAGVYEVMAIAYDNLNAAGSSSSVILFTTLYANDPDIINLYPNPNNGVFTISLVTAPLSEKNIVTISDLTGKILYKSILNKNENLSQFDLHDLDSGIYILMIYSDKITYTKKFIKT